MSMKVEIRRNLTMAWEGTVEANTELLQLLEGCTPKLTKEQENIINKGRQEIERIKEKIWTYIDEHPTDDLLGQPITRETHLIDFDTENIEHNGRLWAVPKTFYIMPKMSEYLNPKKEQL